MSVLIKNVILGISLAAPIGPANIAVIKKGFSNGFFSAFLLGVGVVTADAIYLLLIYFGLSRFLNVPSIQTGIWMFGAVILLHISYQSIQEYVRGVNFNNQEGQTKNSFVEGFAINISNPIAIVWWMGVFGSALAEAVKSSGTKSETLVNSMTIIIGLLIWVFTIALLTHWGRKFLNEKIAGYISLGAGILLAGFAINFGYSAIVSLHLTPLL